MAEARPGTVVETDIKVATAHDTSEHQENSSDKVFTELDLEAAARDVATLKKLK